MQEVRRCKQPWRSMSFENRLRNIFSQTSVAILDSELMKLLGESFELSGEVDGFNQLEGRFRQRQVSC